MFVLDVGGRRIPLGPGRYAIGRASACEVVLHDKMVSRHHATLHVSDSAVILADEESMNGVLVDGRRLLAPLRLEPGTVFEIGPFRLELLLDIRTAWERQVTVQVSVDQLAAEADEEVTSRDLGTLLPARMEGYLDYAERALREANLRSVSRAGRNLRHQIEIDAIRADRCTTESISKLTAFALDLASTVSECSWLDGVFVLARKRSEVLDTDTIDALATLGQKVDLRNNTYFRIYLASLRRRDDLDPEGVARVERLRRLVGDVA